MGFVYKWVNKINTKWYIGSHEGDENDGYMGSGKAFCAAVTKHGIENFSREILYQGIDFREHEGKLLLELDAMHDPMSYNLINDGIGSSGHNNPAYGRTGDKHPMFGKHHLPKAIQIMSEKSSKWGNTPEAKRQRRIQATEYNPMQGKKGELSPSAKLTQVQANEIRRRLIHGESVLVLASEFNVSRFTIARIRDNITYVMR